MRHGAGSQTLIHEALHKQTTTMRLRQPFGVPITSTFYQGPRPAGLVSFFSPAFSLPATGWNLLDSRRSFQQCCRGYDIPAGRLRHGDVSVGVLDPI